MTEEEKIKELTKEELERLDNNLSLDEEELDIE